MAPFFDLLWQRALRPMFFMIDPELAHRMVMALLAGIPAFGSRGDAEALGQDLWGMHFSNPVGLAAGLDKDAAAVAVWQTLGFGFAEVGTITPRPQPGNPRPRLWRLAEDRALINRLGFPSLGMESTAARLADVRRRGLRMRLGVNIGPNKETAPEHVADDIAELADRLGPMADFVVVNVSSPNTPGLREWQAPGHLRTLIASAFPNHAATPAAQGGPPLLIKIAPDLDSEQLRAICDTALDLRLDGIVATNTTIAREAAGVRSDHPGGLSGQPLKARAREVIGEVYRNTEGRLPVIGVGGAASAADAYGHLCAGASLVELYTGLIYEGPGLPAAIKSGLLALMRRDGHNSIAQVIGKSSR